MIVVIFFSFQITLPFSEVSAVLWKFFHFFSQNLQANFLSGFQRRRKKKREREKLGRKKKSCQLASVVT